MRHTLRFTAAILAAFLPAAFAQLPNGSDINKAIPIYFGQVVTGIGDSQAQPWAVYSISLAKAQVFTFGVGVSPDGLFRMLLLRPSALSVGSFQTTDIAYDSGNAFHSDTDDYTVPTAGTYYVAIHFSGGSQTYKLSVQSKGTPILVPNPATAGCLTGRVDYITYSLQLIAAGLPDEVSIGGSRACASCTVKAPLYPEISTRLENALSSNVNVQACYDSGGNIFQIKLVHP